MIIFAQKKIKKSCGAFKTIAILASLVMTLIGNAQTDKQKTDDAALLDSYIQSKGYNNTIVFTPSNIKQFWTEKSVFSQNETINILLDDELKKSSLLRIQLANVDVSQDCRIDIISKNDDLQFSVLSNEKTVISDALQNDTFIGYSVKSATFHLEDTNDYSFFLSFTATNSRKLEVERIVLSFMKNDLFLSSPGKLVITDTNCSTSDAKTKITENSFSLTGIRSRVYSKNRILVSDNTITNSVRIKNIGEKPTKVYLGYAPYTKDGKLIDNKNIPYKSGKVMNVISIDKEKNTIVVDSEPEWEKGCRLVLDAKEDLSDFPNHSFVEGTIEDVKKVDDSHVEILFNKASKKDIKIGTSVRVQSRQGATYLYTGSQLLQPGEEVTFSAKIKKDDNHLKFGSKLCRGTYYVVPVILSNTAGQQEQNTVQIEDFIVEY
jgi:hypothetical protein